MDAFLFFFAYKYPVLLVLKKNIYVAFIFPLFYFFGIIQSTLSYNGGQ